ncbi:glycosyltransferase [uncultured Bacteroides sp.]|uniref:glycosyltransferase family 2 protein n=1 Tax=uncultured Bacteroides sp. TaxID=162156 RepID=UPI00260FEFDA|nr:glycosyltransferase [uncultured Bacteroides sp.]
MPEFSIIVPIYKVEKYLNICVDSVLRQTFNDFELILVDDGSPDKCGNICDNYESSDSRIRVVHKNNGGLSSARNAGLDIATGKYIIFLDSDDYWDDNTALIHIHNNLAETDADLLVFQAKRFYEDANRFTYILNIEVDRNRIIDTNANSAIEYMLENNIYRAAAWNKVIRKSVLDEHQMRFKEGYLSEDMDWCGDLLVYCKRFDFYDFPLYVYRQQRSGSITARKSEKLVFDKLFMCQKGYRQAMALQKEDKDKADLLAGYYAYEYSVLLGISGGIKNKDLLAELKKLEILLDYDICRKVQKVNQLKRIAGFSLTRIALCLFVRIKK